MATRLETRVKKAKGIKTFTTVQKRDRSGKAKLVLVPGSEAKRYLVEIRRISPKVFSTECRLEIGSIGHVSCPGNSNGHICYHSLAAIIRAADGHKVSFCQSREDATKLLQLVKGIIGTLVSHQGKGRLYFVVHAKATKKVDARDTALPKEYSRGRAKLFKD